MKLLIIRPEPGASATAARAMAAGFEPVLLPFFEVQACAWDAPDPGRFDALLITSANAIRHGGAKLELLRSLPVHAVGNRSADAAQAAGFCVATTGLAGIEASLGAAKDLDHHRLLWLAGEDRSEPVLSDAISLTARTVYASAPLSLSADLLARSPAPTLSPSIHRAQRGCLPKR